MTEMLVHDTRLLGNTPTSVANVYRVGGTTPIQQALGWIARVAQSHSGLDKLFIMCHGNAGGVLDTRAQLSDVDLGYGLQFCREHLTLHNIGVTGVLRGLIQEIELHSCGPARTRPDFANTTADGWQFCREFAAHTNATVIASTETQYYTTAWRTHQIDFGRWEGPVMRFSPSGKVARAQ